MKIASIIIIANNIKFENKACFRLLFKYDKGLFKMCAKKLQSFKSKKKTPLQMKF
jgi:hypothetical protein